MLWDLDGTLVDSGDYHWRAWRHTLEDEGVALTYDQFLESFGQRNDRILRNWLGSDASVEDIRRIGDAKEAMYRGIAASEGLTVLPGAREWVERLHEAGWRQAIASSAPRANVDVMVTVVGIAPLIDAIVSAEDVSRGKPEPDVFLTAAEKVGVPAARCIVVEDAAAGVEAARRAAMRSVGVNASVVLPADIYVRSLLELTADVFDRLVISAEDDRSSS